jgi:hypothetical protein
MQLLHSRLLVDWGLLLFPPLPQPHWHKSLPVRLFQLAIPELLLLVLLLASCWAAAAWEPEGRGYEHCEVLAEHGCMLVVRLLLRIYCLLFVGVHLIGFACVAAAAGPLLLWLSNSHAHAESQAYSARKTAIKSSVTWPVSAIGEGIDHMSLLVPSKWHPDRSGRP